MKDFLLYLAFLVAVSLFMFAFYKTYGTAYEHTYSNGTVCYFSPAGDALACVASGNPGLYKPKDDPTKVQREI